jgi:potassium channel subfamily K, other eukaryote
MVHEAQQQLEALPQEILRHAKAFHDDVRYFIGMRVMGDAAHEHLGEEGSQGEVPETLRSLLSDITGAERIGERVRDEILKDDDARKVCSVV